MKTDFSVEPLTPATVTPLLKFFSVNGQLKEEHFYPHPFTLDYMLYIMCKNTQDFYCVIKDTATEDIIGYGILRGWDEGFAVPSLGIALDKDHRGKGLGKFLMEYLFIIAKLRGCTKIRLRVHAKNNTAINMYKKLGFVLAEPMDEYMEGFKEL